MIQLACDFSLNSMTYCTSFSNEQLDFHTPGPLFDDANSTFNVVMLWSVFIEGLISVFSTAFLYKFLGCNPII